MLSTRDPQTGTDEAQISRETDEVFKEHKHIELEDVCTFINKPREELDI